MNGMYAVTCGYHFSHGNRTLALQLPPVIFSSAIFDRIKHKYTYIMSKRRVHRHLGQNLPLDIVTLAVETPPVIISNAIFSRIRSIP